MADAADERPGDREPQHADEPGRGRQRWRTRSFRRARPANGAGNEQHPGERRVATLEDEVREVTARRRGVHTRAEAREVVVNDEAEPEELPFVVHRAEGEHAVVPGQRDRQEQQQARAQAHAKKLRPKFGNRLLVLGEVAEGESTHCPATHHRPRHAQPHVRAISGKAGSRYLHAIEKTGAQFLPNDRRHTADDDRAAHRVAKRLHPHPRRPQQVFFPLVPRHHADRRVQADHREGYDDAEQPFGERAERAENVKAVPPQATVLGVFIELADEKAGHRADHRAHHRRVGDRLPRQQEVHRHRREHESRRQTDARLGHPRQRV